MGRHFRQVPAVLDDVRPEGIWPRRILFVGLASAIVLAPFSRQVLGVPEHRWLRTWQMFSRAGLDVCEVEYLRVERSGESTRLDRYAILRYPRWYDAPEEVRNLPDGPSIALVARRMCDARPGTIVDIRATARCADRGGWIEAMDGEVNLCALSNAQRQALEPRRRER
jgi:hypothetical protein